VLSYLKTVLMVLTTPGNLAVQVWTRDVLWRRAAERFRRIHVLLGTLSVTGVLVAVTATAVGPYQAIACAPVDLAAVLWWFLVLTGEPAQFFQDKGTPTACRRAGVLSAYLSAPLILSPLHLLLLALPVRPPQVDPVLAALVLHGALILLQVLLMASAESALLWQLVELPRGGTLALAAGAALLRCAKGLIYVVVLPVVFANLATALVGR
jgi:hypothetical protein